MKSFEEIVKGRRSVRKFDQEHAFDHDSIERSLKLALLSPNSSNLQTWEFYRIRSKEKLERISEACMNQGAAKTASEMVVFVSRADLWKHRTKWNVAQIEKRITDKNNLTKKEKRALHYYQTLMPLFYNNFPWLIKPLIRKAVVFWRAINGKPMMRFTTKADIRVVSNKSTGLAAQTFMLAMKNEGYDTCPMEGFDVTWVRKILHLPKAADVTMIIGCGKGLKAGIAGERLRLPYDEVVFEV